MGIEIILFLKFTEKMLLYPGETDYVALKSFVQEPKILTASCS